VAKKGKTMAKTSEIRVRTSTNLHGQMRRFAEENGLSVASVTSMMLHAAAKLPQFAMNVVAAPEPVTPVTPVPERKPIYWEVTADDGNPTLHFREDVPKDARTTYRLQWYDEELLFPAPFELEA
jgi:predicted DNA-binding protein with PD1-like motif